jgi:antitoxin component YwqK of YwqJK toxin-antitoxin module
MKKIKCGLMAVILLCSVSASLWGRSVSVHDIRDVDGVIYVRNETTPFTGKISDVKDRNYYFNGKPHGKWVTFHPSGAMKSIENWENGRLNGKFVLYRPDGSKVMETTYANGEDNGRYLLYHPNGKIQIRGQLKMGKAYGVWEYYDKEGRLERRGEVKGD